MKRTWAGEVQNVSLLVASAVNSECYREGGMKGVELIISDGCRGLVGSKPRKRWPPQWWRPAPPEAGENGRTGRGAYRRNAELLLLPRQPSAEDPHQQSAGEDHEGDPPAHTRGGAFPDGQSCLNLAAARLRHIATSQWSTRKYMNMARATRSRLQPTEPSPEKNARKILDTQVRQNRPGSGPIFGA